MSIISDNILVESLDQLCSLSEDNFIKSTIYITDHKLKKLFKNYKLFIKKNKIYKICSRRNRCIKNIPNSRCIFMHSYAYNTCESCRNYMSKFNIRNKKTIYDIGPIPITVHDIISDDDYHP